MQRTKERRKEQRLHIEIPVQFAEASNKKFSNGLMVDLSSIGMAFICDDDGKCPSMNQQLTLKFSIPRYGTSSSDMQQITRTGSVLRIDELHNNRHRIAVRFDAPPFWNLLPNSRE